MSFKYRIVFASFLLIIGSCSKPNQFPEKKTEKVESESVHLRGSFNRGNSNFKADSLVQINLATGLANLPDFKKQYNEKNPLFNLNELERSWNELRMNRHGFGFDDVVKWIDLTGFLFELTGNAIYTEELEKTVYQNYSDFSEAEFEEIEKQITPWIYTKHMDHIHVNLFVNATISYEHSLHGSVEIEQETSYPESGKVIIRFKMQNKRYIELYVRIPEWAEGATVVEKGVKYLAIPGSYCLITRKWKEGDFVEINFPSQKIPKGLKMN